MNLGHDFNDSDESQIGTQDSIVKNMSNSFLNNSFQIVCNIVYTYREA